MVIFPPQKDHTVEKKSRVFFQLIKLNPKKDHAVEKREMQHKQPPPTYLHYMPTVHLETTRSDTLILHSSPRDRSKVAQTDWEARGRRVAM